MEKHRDASEKSTTTVTHMQAVNNHIRKKENKYTTLSKCSTKTKYIQDKTILGNSNSNNTVTL